MRFHFPILCNYPIHGLPQLPHTRATQLLLLLLKRNSSHLSVSVLYCFSVLLVFICSTSSSSSSFSILAPARLLPFPPLRLHLLSIFFLFSSLPLFSLFFVFFFFLYSHFFGFLFLSIFFFCLPLLYVCLSFYLACTSIIHLTLYFLFFFFFFLYSNLFAYLFLSPFFFLPSIRFASFFFYCAHPSLFGCLFPASPICTHSLHLSFASHYSPYQPVQITPRLQLLQTVKPAHKIINQYTLSFHQV